MRALVLSGGGGRGAYELGVYQALAEAGREFDIIGGTSVGAITGAAIAAGMDTHEIEALWTRMHTFRVMHPRADFWRFLRWTHLMSSKPLLRFLEQNIDFDAIARSDIELRVAATEIRTGEVHVFTNEDLTPRRLLASASIPLLFPMVEDEHGVYWDGGAVMNTPLSPVVEAGATHVTAVLLSPLGAKIMPAPRNLWEGIARVADLTLLGNLKEDIKRTLLINDLIAEGHVTGGLHHVDFDIVGPDETLGITTFFNFSGRKARELIDWGHQDGTRHVKGELPAKRVEDQARREADALERALAAGRDALGRLLKRD